MLEGDSSIILRELIAVLLVLVIRIQSRSLLVSLLTVPARAILISRISPDKSSGLVIFVFIIVFIGGLLVLLVRVTSTVYQEQRLAPRVFIFSLSLCLGTIILFPGLKTYDWSARKASLFFWVRELKINFLLFNVIMVVISLLTISLLLIEFKGIIRKL